MAPLDLIVPENIDRIETNLQIAHAPKSRDRAISAPTICSRCFATTRRRNCSSKRRWRTRSIASGFSRTKISKRDFKAWLLDPVHFGELDRGMILIPEKFLATGAIAATPVGFAPSNLQPAFGLVQGEGAATAAVFSESDVVAALKKATEHGISLQNIRSVAGFERRLNDMTCSGCHQTRGIGGFHFPGVDWMAANPSNSNVVPASPHFFGDQIRRRDILTAMRDGKRVGFLPGLFQPPAIARQQRTRRHRI